ncbi:MAG: hypothetical protein CMP36_01590 [Rickettsiales bacterium]|nr:hypothetical protein [Rickettsiales bacterium]OUV81676.1 MAG: hypothetical protein CBC91_02090 [Rickettsiales bacterium TMED131]|tara:strand:+ start:1799 stop:2140 length:342 start_codon:yes stop_codon:yes gene_type:complete
MIKKNTIRYILIFFINFFLFNNAFSFDYEIQTHAKRTILKSFPISDNKKYVSFILEGTCTDNLGNYGLMEQASFVILNNDDVIELDGYGKTIYQDNQRLILGGLEIVKKKTLV